MTEPSYPAARTVADTLQAHFARHSSAASGQQESQIPVPDKHAIEAIIDAAFWASLRREEGFSPKISLALFPSAYGQPLRFEQPLPLTPSVLTRLAPAVERPGIHLGVWRDGGELCVWGTAREIPVFCFVLEVIEPGLLVVKYRRGQDTGKFVNVMVLKGDQIKEVDEKGSSLPDCPALVEKLLGFGSHNSTGADSVNVLVELAASMRTHGRGGTLLVVAHNSQAWRDSIVQPIIYSVLPPHTELAELMRQEASERSRRLWQEAFLDAVESVAGSTAVDGATVISDEYELLAFGAKIARRDGGTQVEQVIVTEPIIGGEASIVHPVQLGGTRHLSAAQFVQDQTDAVALVASQDGRFTVFAWSPCEQMVHAHRVETLLL